MAGLSSLIGSPMTEVTNPTTVAATGQNLVANPMVSVTDQALVAVTDPKDPIVDLLAKLDRGDLGLVQAADCIEEILGKANHTYTMDIAPRQVGLDPSNRDGEGGNAQAVLLLAADIFDVGFSWEATRHATCVEVIPGSRDVEIFNQKFSIANGLAAVPDNSIHFGSLSGGHTNYVLRCIVGHVPSTKTEMCDKGCFSLDVIRRRDPTFAQAAEQGLKWRVFRWQVRLLWPRALQVVQAARNVPSAMNRRVSEMQGLCQLHSLAAATMASGDKPDWTVIKRAVLRSKPAWGEYIDDLILFVAAKSGGVEGPFLELMKRFFRQWVDTSVRSSLPGSLYGVLSDMPWTHVCLAIWVTAYTCPKEHVRAGHCSWVTVSDVKALMHGSPETKLKCVEAEECLRQARGRLATARVVDLEKGEVTKVLTRLDIAVGRFLLGKQDASKVKFQTIAEVGRQFVAELVQMVPGADGSVYDDLWPRAQSSVPEQKVADPTAIALVSLDAATGQVKEARARLRSCGFDVGATVSRKASTGIYKVLDVDGDVEGGHVSLEQLPVGIAAFPASVTVEDFLQNWVLVDAKAVVELHRGWPACRSSQTTAGRTLRAKGTILAALGCLTELMDEAAPVVEKLAVLTKPVRRVVATGHHAVAELHLVPETTNVKAMTDAEFAATSPEDAASLIEVKIEPPCSGHRFFLVGVTGPDNMAPAWCVRTSVVDNEATCRWTNVEVQMLAGIDFLEEHLQPLSKRRKLLGKTPPAKAKTTKKLDVVEEAVVDTKVTIPLLVNIVPIKDGGELVVHRARVEKRLREPAPITMATLAGRVRSAKAAAAAKASGQAASSTTF